jgi:multiple sugar transport system permease protein
MADAATAPLATTKVRAATRRRTARERRHSLTGWLFIAPFGVVFLVFLVTPLAYAFYLSLFSKGLATGTAFAGINNYVRAFTDPSFLKGVWFVVRFSIVLIPVQMLVSLAAALVLDNLTNRFARFARLMIFLPYAVPAVIGALMWGFLYSPSFGPLEQIFGAFGADAPFLLSPDNIFFGLMNVVTWQWAGYYMIIIYAALRGIDPTIYEAARSTARTRGRWRCASRSPWCARRSCSSWSSRSSARCSSSANRRCSDR